MEKKRTLLIVDDIKSNREILKNILGGDYEIIEAEHGQEAIAVMTAEYKSISAILLDLSMPIMDGYEVLAYMQGNEMLRQLPVIVTTGMTYAGSEEKALRLGAKDYIAKPYKSAIIKQRILNTIILRETSATVNALLRDRLTGLYSRDAFFDRVSAAVTSHEAGYYTMASFDVEKFKVINDQYGTEKGDEALRHIASVFQAGFESNGGLCCRIAADDFAVLYPTKFQGSEQLAEIRRKATVISGLSSPVSFSIGRYVIDNTAISPSAMYDRALLAAASVKGRYDAKIAVYDEAMRSSLIQEQQIVSEMEHALAEKQFEIWYQPQYNHATGALIGAEALIRWRHPQRGLISPGIFVPIFEQNGFIYKLDRYVWEGVCRYQRSELDAGRASLPVSVNISRYDVFKPDFVEYITGLIREYRLPVELLRLEITESAFSESTNHIVSVAKQLIDFGFTLEIDDFGSGYSSLNTLKSVPAQVVKLDMRFFEGNDDSERGGNIIESVVRMTKWLGMSVIAEGVEIVEQADFLKSIGCNYIQGYLYAKPMPVEDYRALCSETDREEKLLALETVDNLDNNSFWNPKSMDTLIFNSYVGAACIFEYCEGKIDLLRVSPKYSQLLAGVGLCTEDALRLNWAEHLEQGERELLRDALEQSKSTHNDVMTEISMTGIPHCSEKLYLRFNLRVIAVAGNRCLVYCIYENITAQREAERSSRSAAEQVRKVSEQLRWVLDGINCGVIESIVDGENVEYLFVNDRYFEILGYTEEQFAAEVPNIFDISHPSDREGMYRAVQKANTVGAAATLEYRVFRRNGTEIWLRTVIATRASEDIDKPVQISFITDITEEKTIEQTMLKTDEQLHFLNDMSHELLAKPDVEAGINSALQKLMEYFSGDRAYIFEFDKEKKIAVNTYEACEKGVSAEIEKLKNVPFSLIDFLAADIDKQGFYAIYDVSSLADENPAKEHFSAQGITALFVVPLRRDGDIIGMIGIDNPKIQMTQIERFAALGDYIAVMLTRRDLNLRIGKDNEALSDMMNDMPGGFVRMQLLPNGAVIPVYFNSSFYRLTDMNYGELMRLYRDDAYAGVHPEDLPVVKEAVADILEHGGGRSAKYRLRHGSDGYIWVTIFGRATKNHSGDTFLNIYYTDVTEQVREEKMQEMLLDNLPGGAGIFSFSGTALTAVYLNKSYRNMIGGISGEYSAANPLDEVFPDDIPVLRCELKSAIEHSRDLVCTIRLRNMENNYINVRAVGHITKKTDDEYIIFTTFTPISDSALSYQQIMPLLLSAMAESTTDLFFSKDTEFRYLTVSKSFLKLVRLESESDVIGKTDYELFDRKYADRFREDDEVILGAEKAVIDKEETISSPDGTLYYFTTSKYILRDGSGKVIGLYGIGHDITKSVHQDSQLALINDSIPGGLSTYVCTDGDFSSRNIRLTYYNDGFCKLFGYTRSEFEQRENREPAGMLFEEDRHILIDGWHELLERNVPTDCTYRIHVNGGGYKWISHMAVIADRINETVVINALLQDVTEQREILEHLRVSEEENRLAMQHTRNIICRYDIASSSLRVPKTAQIEYSVPEIIADVPSSPISGNSISAETADAYKKFYDSIRSGAENGAATFCRRSDNGWRWLDARYSTIFSENGEPVSAVITFEDITEQLEKEAAYQRWQQSLSSRASESYTLFRCNLSKKTGYDTREGALLTVDFTTGEFSFDEHTAEYASAYVVKEDEERFLSFLNVDALLAGFYQGRRTVTLEYREKLPDGDCRWLRLTVEMTKRGNTANIEAYMLFENIDERKRQEIEILEQAETDPLTGVLNRNTFAAQVNSVIAASSPNALHAMLLLDMDNFKRVNDVFGHSVGDRAIIDIADGIRSVVRGSDIVGRLSGDEFLIFIPDISGDVTAAAKAQQICAVVRKSFSVEVELSGSVGIAVAPRDGTDFDALYKKADSALYYVKGSGKNNYTFYREEMADEHFSYRQEADNGSVVSRTYKKRRMLIVDDSFIDHAMLSNIFAEQFIIEKAKDGSSALIGLRHYGSAVSVVLLDLVMPVMDGFAVLQKMRENPELQNIPVIVVSSDDDRETSLRAIRAGAVDFVSKPVDPDILRIRVQSAISKAENNRLRTQNSALEYQNSEITRYRTALEVSETFVIENDWVAGNFTYDRDVSAHIAGHYDDRGFWHILLSDFVAETLTVQKMQNMVRDVASDRDKTNETALVNLMAADNTKHWFRLNVYKIVNDFGLTGKIYLIFTDMGTERPKQ